MSINPSPSQYFDAHGRCVPTSGNELAHARSRRYFLCQQKAIDYRAIHGRLASLVPEAVCPISIDEFSNRAEAILSGLAEDERTAGILNGTRIPFMLPQGDWSDQGAALDQFFLPAVRRNFSACYPDRAFVNHTTMPLGGRLNAPSSTRQHQLLEATRQGWVVGYYFPCLSEYSIPAAFARIAELPNKFILAGGIDTAAAIAGTPDALLRTDGYPPVLWLAALQGENPQAGYHFEAYGYNLTFNRRIHLNQVAESWSCALVVLG